ARPDLSAPSPRGCRRSRRPPPRPGVGPVRPSPESQRARPCQGISRCTGGIDRPLRCLRRSSPRARKCRGDNAWVGSLADFAGSFLSADHASPPRAASHMKFTRYQILVVALLAFLQFTVVLDFMILSPLGALLLQQLHISTAQFGLVVSAYAFSA